MEWFADMASFENSLLHDPVTAGSNHTFTVEQQAGLVGY